MMQIAIYDMDRTITRHGTYAGWLLFFARRAKPWRLALLPFSLLYGLLYLVGAVSRRRLKELNQALLMGRAVDAVRVAKLADDYAARVLAQECYADAIVQIASDRVAGRRILLATASYAFYADAIARRLGIADVVATRSQRDARGRIRARIDGTNCYGGAKLDMVKAYLQAAGLERGAVHVRAYTDHQSDLPLLDFADEPVAINPTTQLRGVARGRGWQIVDWS